MRRSEPKEQLYVSIVAEMHNHSPANIGGALLA
jgi:hypothetical protein